MNESKIQPVKVAQEAKTFVDTWSGLIEEMCAAIADEGAVADAVLCNVQRGIASISLSEAVTENKGDCVVIGLLLALREVSSIDAGLLEGCQRLEGRSAAMNKFIQFLSEEMEDDESADADGPDEDGMEAEVEES